MSGKSPLLLGSVLIVALLGTTLTLRYRCAGHPADTSHAPVMSPQRATTVTTVTPDLAGLRQQPASPAEALLTSKSQSSSADRHLGLGPSGETPSEPEGWVSLNRVGPHRDNRVGNERRATSAASPQVTASDISPPVIVVPQTLPTVETSLTLEPNTEQLLALAGKALVVDQVAQLMHVYEDGVEIRTLPVSTGVPPLYTPAFHGRVGRYATTIYSHGQWADNAWYVLTAGGNIYIHSSPYRVVEGTRVYQGLEFLGVQPSSHGCIRLHPADAEWLTAWNPEGVLIVIRPPDLTRE